MTHEKKTDFIIENIRGSKRSSKYHVDHILNKE